MQNFYNDLTIANGLKGNIYNSSYFDVELGNNYREKWRNLKNLRVYQSPTIDGKRGFVYASGNNTQDNNKQVMASIGLKTGFLNWYQDLSSAAISPCIDENGFIYSAHIGDAVKINSESEVLWKLSLSSKVIGLHIGVDGNIYYLTANGNIYKISNDGRFLNHINVVENLKLKSGRTSDNAGVAGVKVLLSMEGWSSRSFCMDENYLYVHGRGKKFNEGAIIKLSIVDLSIVDTLFLKNANRALMAPCLSMDGKYLIILEGNLFSGKYQVIDTNTMKVKTSIDASYIVSSSTPSLDLNNNLTFYYRKDKEVRNINIETGKINWKFKLSDNYSTSYGFTTFKNSVLFFLKKSGGNDIVFVDKNSGEKLFLVETDINGTCNNASIYKNSDNLYFCFSAGVDIDIKSILNLIKAITNGQDIKEFLNQDQFKNGVACFEKIN